MSTVIAEFQERKRIVFTARGRSVVNVRDRIEDGPIGYTSEELLLVALGNCSLGTLLAHPLLAGEPVRSVSAVLEATMEHDPVRVTQIRMDITVEVAADAPFAHVEELADAAGHCPVGNSLLAEKQIKLRFVHETRVGALAAVATGAPLDEPLTAEAFCLVTGCS